MWQNFLTIAVRALRRRPFATALTVGGLALGLTVFLFLAEYAAFHHGFDRFHARKDDVFRFVTITPNAAQEYTSPRLMFMRQRLPDVEAMAFINQGAEGTVSYRPQNDDGASLLAFKELVFKEENVMLVNGDFFRVFTVPFLAGAQELDKPNTVVIAESAARKYFGCTEGRYETAIGKTLTMANQFGVLPYRVTGVYRELPVQSSLQATMLFSLQTLATAALVSGNSWARLTPDNGNGFLHAFVLLRSGANAASVENTLNALRGELEPNERVSFRLQPLTDIHIGADFSDPLPNDGALKLIAAASGIALIVLALAWINYVNLTTAFGLSRAREIGVRKAIGAARSQLMMQYLLECAVVSGFALLVAFAAVELVQKPFNELVGARLGLSLLKQGFVWVVVAAVTLVGVIASGLYVSLVLTKVNASEILRGSFVRSNRGARVRTTLVVVQFAASVVLIAGTIIIFQQLDFMRRRDLGMNLEQLVVVEGAELLDDEAPGGARLAENAFAFKQEVARLPFVRSVAGSQNVPGQAYNFTGQGFMRPTGQVGDDKKPYRVLMTDEQFFNTYEMTFAAGKSYATRDNLGGFKFRAVAVNEAAAAQLGFRSAEEAVGQVVNWGDPNSLEKKGQTVQIAGVVKNYHHKSLKKAIDPIVFLPSEATRYYTIRMNTRPEAGSVQANIAQLETLYKRLLPGNPFVYHFADEMFRKQYENDERIGTVFSLFAVAAVVIACLGLLGLTAFAVQQRTKEIGVRKVLGASVASIVALLTKDFLKLVGVAVVLAVPLAYWLAGRWLQEFAYRIELGAWIFALSGALALGIAFLTVSIQAVRAARANVVESLRYE